MAKAESNAPLGRYRAIEFRTCPLTEENPRCFSCAVGVQRERGRGAIRGGVVAVPLLIAAMLAHDARLSLAAAAISVVAVIVYTARTLMA